MAELTTKQRQLLDSLYYDIKSKSSLRGVLPLYKAAKQKDSTITIRLVKDWLK